jgi:hypothetical protein
MYVLDDGCKVHTDVEIEPNGRDAAICGSLLVLGAT